MPTKQKKIETEIQLAKEVKNLTKEVSKLKNLEFMKVFKHPVKFMWYSFLKGIMIGFGSALGATVILAVFLYLVGQISFVPLIGGFVEEVISEITTEINSEISPDTPQAEVSSPGGFATDFSAVIPEPGVETDLKN